MHKILTQDGTVDAVTVTPAEWRAIHRDYKTTTHGQRRTLVLCPVHGTVLVRAHVTATGLPVQATA